MAEGKKSVELFVGQVPKHMREAQVLAMFKEFASVDDVNIIKDKTIRDSREHKLFIGMLPKNVSEAKVSALYSKYGTIKDLQILRGSQQKSEGCAFLKYETKEQALASLEAINGKHKMGCSFGCQWAHTERKYKHDEHKKLNRRPLMYQMLIHNVHHCLQLYQWDMFPHIIVMDIRLLELMNLCSTAFHQCRISLASMHNSSCKSRKCIAGSQT